LTLAVDLMYINKISFMIKTRTIHFSTVEIIKAKEGQLL